MREAQHILAIAGWQLETHAIGDRAMDEVLDMSNYMRMTYIKLVILQAHIAKLAAESPAVNEKGFVPMKEFLQQ